MTEWTATLFTAAQVAMLGMSNRRKHIMPLCRPFVEYLQRCCMMHTPVHFELVMWESGSYKCGWLKSTHAVFIACNAHCCCHVIWHSGSVKHILENVLIFRAWQGA